MLGVECSPDAVPSLTPMANDQQSRPSYSPARRWRIGFDVVLRTALVLAVMVMLNYLGAKCHHRFYLSAQTEVALSSRTLAVLHSLTNQVTATLYYDTHDAANFYPTIRALLDAYHDANKNIPVRTVDYTRDATEAEKAKAQYNLPGAPTSPNSPPNKDLIIFASGDRHDVSPGADTDNHTGKFQCRCPCRRRKPQPVS